MAKKKKKKKHELGLMGAMKKVSGFIAGFNSLIMFTPVVAFV